VDRVGRLGVGGLRAEVKAERRPDQTGESWQKLVEQLLGFIEVAMRGVESHSRDGEQREDQRQRDSSADPVTPRLWIIAFFGSSIGVRGRTGWLSCVDIGNLTGKAGLRPQEKGPAIGAFWEN
jgi:hypothetical protein